MAVTRDEVLARHRAGDLQAAETGYRALLRDTPNDPDLIGLTGILALQKGDGAAAERLLRQALAAGGAPVIALRNLNTLVVLLRNAGREDKAAALVAEGLPALDPAAPPGAAELPAVLSLAEAAVALGHPERAIELLAPLRQAGRADDRVLELSGRAAMAAGRPAEAVGLLWAAADSDRANPEPRIALAAAQDAAGDADSARRTTMAIMATFPFLPDPPQPGHRATILVINPPPGRITDAARTLRQLHFRDNFIAQLAQRAAGRYRFVSVFPAPDMERLLPELPPVDLVIGNLAVPEQALNDATHAALERFLGALGAPVLNRPADIGPLTRDRVAGLLAGCPGLHVPRALRITGRAARAAAFGEFPAAAPFPAILRDPHSHSSSGSAIAGADVNAFLARSRETAANWIGLGGLTDFYLIEYVDLERPGGIFRRFRAMVAGDEILLHSAGYYDHWLVGGWRIGDEAERFYGAHPECIVEGAAAVADPEAALGAGPMQALRALRARIPMDLFGVDFDIDAEGRVVVFEVSSAMIFLPMGQIPEHLQPLAQTPERIDAVCARLIDATAGVPGA